MYRLLVGSALLFGVLATSAAAEDRRSEITPSDIFDHVSFGYLAHDVAGLWSGFRLERAATAENIDLVFAPHLDILYGSIRPALGGTIVNGDGTSYGYVDARYEITGPYHTFFGIGLGLAVHNGILSRNQPLLDDMHGEKALGSRGLFHVPIEIGVTIADRFRISAYFEHVSNGWIGTSVNEGMDNIGGRIGYKF